jgi:glycosyltransferase involved in cell wall biosynthesis
MPNQPLISVVIPYFNCPEIGACLESLSRQTYSNAEIIVVNNNSSKKHLALLANRPIRIENEKIQSSYAARNRGARCARGAYLAFIDADCTADPEWLATLWLTAENENAEMVLGNVKKTISRRRLSHEYVDRDLYHNHRRLFSQGSGTTANLFISKRALDSAAGFSPHSFSGGDTALIQKLVRSGVAYAYAENAVVFQQCRKTLLSLMAKGFRTGVASGNDEANRFMGLDDRMKYVRWRCLALLNPFRADMALQVRSRSYPYAFAYFMHFAAQGLGRSFGITKISRTPLCRKLMRYT